jgi:hypothetical protein
MSDSPSNPADTPTEQAPMPEGEAKEELRKLAPVLGAVGGNAASAIMTNPRLAQYNALEQPERIKHVVDQLPGLVGAIDHALHDQVGRSFPFVLLIFAEDVALHSANFQPDVARNAVIELAQRWDSGDEAVLEEGGAGDAANDNGPTETTH